MHNEWNGQNHNLQSIELDWIEEYKWLDPPRLLEAVSGKGSIQDSEFSPGPCTKEIGKSKMAASYFCILLSDWPKWIYSSIQVQLYASVCTDAQNKSHNRQGNKCIMILICDLDDHCVPIWLSEFGMMFWWICHFYWHKSCFMNLNSVFSTDFLFSCALPHP